MTNLASKQFSPRVEHFLSFVGATPAAQYFWCFNSSYDAPYHNAIHVGLMLEDLINAIRIGAYKPSSKGELQAFAEAIIFHDFRHSMGLKKDPENIEIALEGYRSFLVLNPNWNDWPYSERSRMLIRASQYPYSNNGVDPEDEAVLLMRDIDLMSFYRFSNLYNYQNDGNESAIEVATRLIVGLWAESFSDMDWEEFVQKNIKFLWGATWQSDYGMKLAEHNQRHAMEAMRATLIHINPMNYDEEIRGFVMARRHQKKEI
jgi:hypothetical protein